MMKKGYNYPIKIKIALASILFSWFGNIIIHLFRGKFNRFCLKINIFQFKNQKMNDTP